MQRVRSVGSRRERLSFPPGSLIPLRLGSQFLQPVLLPPGLVPCREAGHLWELRWASDTHSPRLYTIWNFAHALCHSMKGIFHMIGSLNSPDLLQNLITVLCMCRDSKITPALAGWLLLCSCLPTEASAILSQKNF